MAQTRGLVARLAAHRSTLREDTMSKVALFGGSFNPPHVCHVLAATWVLSVRPVDEVWFMPVGQHAFGKQLESFEHRRSMCELARAPIAAQTRVTDIENRLGGANRTIDTLQALDAEHPDVELASSSALTSSPKPISGRSGTCWRGTTASTCSAAAVTQAARARLWR